LQIIGKQQLDLKFPSPGSHCSPASTFPFPHTGAGAPGGLITGGKGEDDPATFLDVDGAAVPDTVLPGLLAGTDDAAAEAARLETTGALGVRVCE